ncbi:MAG: MCE family protein, partial [Zavarzinella sp.]|nr:MCE family protein [Zavarzinella sp.]
MTRTLSIRQAATLGLVVVLCLATGVWGLFRVSAKSGLWAETCDLTIVSADARNVEPGTPVRVRGIEYGRVTSVEPSGDNVCIQVRLDRKARDLLFADASATVQTKGV